MRRGRWAIGGSAAAVVLGIAAGALLAVEAQPPVATVDVYMSPDCDCCAKWAESLRKSRFKVVTHTRHDLSPVRARLSVPDDLASCHTAEVAGYAIEGHVPAADIRRLLRQHTAVRGLAVSNMPYGAPGMDDDDRSEPFEVVGFTDDGGRAVVSRH